LVHEGLEERRCLYLVQDGKEQGRCLYLGQKEEEGSGSGQSVEVEGRRCCLEAGCCRGVGVGGGSCRPGWTGLLPRH